MNIEELQALWKTQAAAPAIDEPALLQKIKAESRSFDRAIRRRDWREFAAALLLIGLWLLPSRVPAGPRWPQVLAVVVVLLVPVFAVLARYRVQRRRPPAELDVRHELAHAVEHTRLQVRLLRSVTWWYLLPLWLAGLLIEYHRSGVISAHWWKMQAWVMLPFFVFVYWLNQRAVRKNLQPQLDQLVALRAEWNDLASGAPPPHDDRRAT